MGWHGPFWASPSPGTTDQRMLADATPRTGSVTVLGPGSRSPHRLGRQFLAVVPDELEAAEPEQGAVAAHVGHDKQSKALTSTLIGEDDSPTQHTRSTSRHAEHFLGWRASTVDTIKLTDQVGNITTLDQARDATICMADPTQGERPRSWAGRRPKVAVDHLISSGSLLGMRNLRPAHANPSAARGNAAARPARSVRSAFVPDQYSVRQTSYSRAYSYLPRSTAASPRRGEAVGSLTR